MDKILKLLAILKLKNKNLTATKTFHKEFSIYDVNIDRITVHNKVSFGNKVFKYFIG